MVCCVQPIGSIQTPFRSVSDCPRNGRQIRPAPQCQVLVDAPYRAGLQGLEGFSHLILLYWLDQQTGMDLLFTPPFERGSDAPARGVFASRAPWRPNPIGLSVVAFDGFAAQGQLLVRHLDCVSGTPLLDIKPYLPTTDSEPDATMGWLAPHATPR